MTNKFKIKFLPEDIYYRLFILYGGQPERFWIEKWWGRLLGKGLTSYCSAKEYNAVLSRLVTIAYLYHRWAGAAYGDDCGIEDQMSDWYDLLPWIHDKDLGDLPDEWFNFDLNDDHYKLRCLYSVIEREFNTVVEQISPMYKQYGVCGLAQELRQACGRPPLKDGFPTMDISFSTINIDKELWEETGLIAGEMAAIIFLQELRYD